MIKLSRIKSYINYNLIVLSVLLIFVVSCSKSYEELEQELSVLNSEVNQLVSEEKYEEAINRAEEALKISIEELKDDDAILSSLVLLLELHFVQVIKYDESNEFDKALLHYDDIMRKLHLLSNVGSGYVDYALNSSNIDISRLDNIIENINKKYIKSLPKKVAYPSDKPVVLFILDGSGSMYQSDLEAGIKIDIAKNTIKSSISKLNDNKVNLSLMSFNKGCDEIDLLVPPTNKDYKNILNSMKLIYPFGLTPLAKSIREAGDVLRKSGQYVRLVIVSDGKDTCEGDEAPIAAVKMLKDEYGINVEVFTIGYSVDSETKIILQSMAKIGGGQYFNVSNEADFNQAFDNIIPPDDRDTDWDGVLNKQDRCPNTPNGIDVDKNGCPKNYKFKVQFNYAKATLTTSSLREVRNFAVFLKNNPTIKAYIEGHTDATGTSHLALSSARAETVKNKLVEMGIESKRLESIGYGKSRPVQVGNDKENRRVEARLLTESEAFSKKSNLPNVQNKLTNTNPMIIIGAGVALREKSDKNSKKIEALHFGNIVNVSLLGVDWVKIVTSTGQNGWIERQYLVSIDQNNKYSTYITISNNKFNSSKNDFGNLVEIVNFINYLFEIEGHENEELRQLRDTVLERSLSIIPNDKKDETPYVEWRRINHSNEKIK